MLYLVPTPIGNLQDITQRALKVLEGVDLILAEDTRTSKKLLQHFCINTPIKSHHMHNEHREVPHLVEQLQSGLDIALISDAGTPGISDPGFLLTRACIQAGIEVSCLPGPTAFVPALVMSGLPNDRFVFEGFLPQKKGRQTRLKLLAEEERTMVFYEAPHRLIKTLTQMAPYFGEDRQVAVSREISKKFEETVRGSLDEVRAYFESHPAKGELVLVVAGRN